MRKRGTRALGRRRCHFVYSRSTGAMIAQRLRLVAGGRSRVKGGREKVGFRGGDVRALGIWKVAMIVRTVADCKGACCGSLSDLITTDPARAPAPRAKSRSSNPRGIEKFVAFKGEEEPKGPQ
jgi:hypothetical protein